MATILYAPEQYQATTEMLFADTAQRTRAVRPEVQAVLKY